MVRLLCRCCRHVYQLSYDAAVRATRIISENANSTGCMRYLSSIILLVEREVRSKHFGYRRYFGFALFEPFAVITFKDHSLR